MRGLGYVVFLSCLITPNLSSANPQTFVESCLQSTGALQKQLVCEVRLEDNRSLLRFTLEQGQEINISARGQFGNFDKELPVFKITHLPPRITDEGVMGESIEFAAKGGFFGNVEALVTVPCQQTDYAAIGIEKDMGNSKPEQIIAQCKVQ